MLLLPFVVIVVMIGTATGFGYLLSSVIGNNQSRKTASPAPERNHSYNQPHHQTKPPRPLITPGLEPCAPSSPYVKPLLNKTELRFLRQLFAALRRYSLNGIIAVVPQAPLSQFVQISKINLNNPQLRGKAYTLVCDFLIVSQPYFLPVVAVEVNGKGHYQNGYQVRDALKKEILQKAGIPLVCFDLKNSSQLQTNREVDCLMAQVARGCIAGQQATVC